jgi:hypothetical protein
LEEDAGGGGCHFLCVCHHRDQGQGHHGGEG